MYCTIVSIIAAIALIWFGCMLFNCLLLYLKQHRQGDESVCLTREIYVGNVFCSEFYLFPSVSFSYSYAEKTDPTITFRWFTIEITIIYHIKTEKEENIEAEIRRKLNKNESKRV